MSPTNYKGIPLVCSRCGNDDASMIEVFATDVRGDPPRVILIHCYVCGRTSPVYATPEVRTTDQTGTP